MDYYEKRDEIVKWFINNKILDRFLKNVKRQRPSYNPFAIQELNSVTIEKSFI